MTRGIAVWKTWGKKCESIVFACNCENVLRLKELLKNGTDNLPIDIIQYEPVVDMPILQLRMQEDGSKMGRKCLLIMKIVYEIYKDLFEWYYLIDDDTYVFVDNLNKYTSTLNSTQPYMYGNHYKLLFINGYVHGGAGLLFTNKTMELFYNKIVEHECDKYITFWGDVTIGRCANSIGIKIGDTYDAFRRPRFHNYAPELIYYGRVPTSLDAMALTNGKTGKECCSLESIAFHYLTPEEIYSIDSIKSFLQDLLK